MSIEHRTEGVAIADGLQRIWSGRRVLLSVTGSFLLAALLYLMIVDAEFEASGVLVPEKQSNSMSLDLGMLSQFGGVLGLGNSDLLSGNNQSLPVDLYPQILHSIPVQLELLNTPVRWKQREVTLYEYMQKDVLSSGLLSFSSFTGGPTIEGGELPLPTAEADPMPVRLSQKQESALKELTRRMNARFSVRSGVLSVSAVMPDAMVAAQVAEAGIKQLRQYVHEYRMNKLQLNLDFIRSRHSEAKVRFNRSLDSLAAFRDRNQHLVRDAARTEEQRLQAEYDLAFNVYNSLSSKLEDAQIQVEEQRPVFKVLQPVTVPSRRSFPPIGVTLALSVLLGACTGAGFLWFRPDLERAAMAIGLQRRQRNG